MLQRLRNLPPEHISDASARLRNQVLPFLKERQHICLYAPLPHEINLLPLLDEAPMCHYYFPRCLPGRQLSFHRVQKPAIELTPGSLGILAPLPSLPTISPQEIDLVIVPGIAFTPQGARLGYGGGYYDRFLPQLSTKAYTIALAMHEQMAENLPTESHDILINRILIA